MENIPGPHSIPTPSLFLKAAWKLGGEEEETKRLPCIPSPPPGTARHRSQHGLKSTRALPSLQWASWSAPLVEREPGMRNVLTTLYEENPDTRGGEVPPGHDSPGKGPHACMHPVKPLARIDSLRESLGQGCPQLPGGWGQLGSFPWGQSLSWALPEAGPSRDVGRSRVGQNSRAFPEAGAGKRNS